MRALPQVSMGLPVYNGLPYVEELVVGLLAQTFGDFEIVICDNASDDGTEDLLRAYAKQDARIKYVRNPTNIGLIRNYNRVFELSCAPFYKWVAADDLYDPNYLEVCLPAVRDDASVSVSHCQTALIDGSGNELPYDPDLHGCVDTQNGRRWLLDRDQCATDGSRTRRFRDVLAQQIMCAPIYGLIPREVLLKTGLNKSFFGSDKLLLAELALHGRFHIAPRKLFKKRMHAEMASVMDGSAQQKKIDPLITLSSLKAVKFRSYIQMLRAASLSPTERLTCLAYLAVHSASAVLPETVKYRPERLRTAFPVWGTGRG